MGFFGATPIVRPSSTTDLRAAFINLGLYTTGGATPLDLNGGGVTASGVNSFGATTLTGNLTLSTYNIVSDTSTGTKIGTATSQKFGFFNATPIVQPSSTTDLRVTLINLGLLATGGATPLDLNGASLTALNVTLTGNAYFTRASQATVQYGNINVGDGGFTGGGGHYSGASGGSLVAVNLVSGGTADLINLQINGVMKFKLGSAGNINFGEAVNIVLGTTSGTQFGTATSQKIGFFGVTPIVQNSSTTDLRTGLINLGLWATGGATGLNLNGGDLNCNNATFSGSVSGNGTALTLKRLSFTWAADANETLDSTNKAAVIIDIQTGVITAQRDLLMSGNVGAFYIILNRNAQAVNVRVGANAGIVVAATRIAIICFPGGTTAFRITPDTVYTV
jgi:hypothetical protein